ncbi:hypothetical protein MAR_008073 [Mya arenaria]|uniref:Uncharacterized protein n=1 Tax=Mya arenaria TaxID=6604 RepID=A0ABY7DVM1_MYAAR|nr:hypothetical protein MAR_008073 [Mya arenaria]
MKVHKEGSAISMAHYVGNEVLSLKKGECYPSSLTKDIENPGKRLGLTYKESTIMKFSENSHIPQKIHY